MTSSTLDKTPEFSPQWNADGLLPCITIEDSSGEVLMMAWMNEDALCKTLESEEMHYWSRSRGELWHKGATSGQIQTLVSLSIDCDQDCFLARVTVQSDPPVACHTGRKSCFYREITIGKDKQIKLALN